MKVSIITITYNSEKTLKDTIESVINQSYPEIEYIIKDGGSKDATLAITSAYLDRLKVVSTPDKGIYDAMNQGVQQATGDIIGVINSDDFYPDELVVQRVVEYMEKHQVDAVYGDLQYVDAEDTSKVLRYWKAGNYKRENFLKGWMPPHPTFFVKRKIYEQFGYFNANFKSAGDYEIMLRFLFRHKASTGYIPHILVKMRAGGVSNVSLHNRIRANKEDRHAWAINGLKPNWYTLYAKPLSKVFQWIKK